MSSSRRWLKNLSVTILLVVVIASFVLSSIGWRLFESSESSRIIIATCVLLIMYALMIFEVVDRTLAALIGAAMSIAAHDCLIGYATMEEIIRWEDLETLSLLFGMMIIVNVLSESGLFNFLAVWSYDKSGGHFWLLISIMMAITGILSALMDNVSTMLLMSPTLIKLSELEHLDPRYVLMIMVLACNIGGCATPVGDPPNLIIIGDPISSSLGVTFGTFTATCGPCAILCLGAQLLYLKIVYKNKNSFRPKKQSKQLEPTEGTIIERPINYAIPSSKQLVVEYHQLLKLKNLADELGELVTEDCRMLKSQLETITANHQAVIERDELKSRKEQLPDVIDQSMVRRGSRLDSTKIKALRSTYSIKNKTILIQSLSVLVITVLLFFIQSIPEINLTLGWVSLFAGLSLLVLSSSTKMNQENSEEEEEEDNFTRIINRIEWPTLIFFFALFIVMEVMAKLGLIVFLGRQVTHLINLIPSGSLRSMGAITIVLWSSGIASACIDNVPFTSMMIKVLGSLVIQSRAADPTSASLRLVPLVYSLVFGACLGGNGTIIGASANLVTAGIAAREGFPISFNKFAGFAAPITILTLLVSNIYLIVVFVLLEW